ncbi:tol-pal system protein YbgF [Rhodoblastus sp.]|jgi:tol-pal system protein YbgF|uniref:tol-pal system protein YbgF n=1 Tax=Rhodoblastus sp. TaxID=1962975 RepID=UPI002615875B|nr:tol-pal system protein YbgF [Rhodoblastus sp.]
MAILSSGAFRFAPPRKTLVAATAAAALVAGAGAARAQFFDRPPANVQNQGGDAAASNDTSSLLRVDRLESQVRTLNGQVEQLQFQVKRLEDQLRKFQMDVDSRFQDSAARPAPAGRPAATTPQRRSDVMDGDAAAPRANVADNAPDATPLDAVPPVAANPAVAADLPPPAAAPSVTVGADGRRHDAFDPSSQPNAPGAPLALGSADSASKPVERPAQPVSSASAAETPSGPLDLTPPSLRGAGSSVAAVEPAPVAPAPAAAPADPVKADYDAAIEQLKVRRYDAAQQAFAAFVQKNPHSRLIAPAIYHLGEAYYYQSRHREAAEQFLKIATDFAKSPVAPDAMVKLGVSLNALGAKEQACAFFSELPRKYPNASPSEKSAAEREAKKAAC